MTSIPTDVEIQTIASQWEVEPIDLSFVTHSSRLLAGFQHGRPVMLKMTNYPEEIAGGAVLQWWNGDGAVDVLERSGNALMMARVTGNRSLLQQCLDGDDVGPIAIMCDVLDHLHKPRATPPPETISLERWFVDLLDSDPVAPDVIRGKQVAQSLLASQQDQVVLHGDIHHRNVLDSDGDRWLVIDPKGLYGERTFDYVNIFRNPTTQVAANFERFGQRVDQISELAHLDRQRLLAWIAAYCALSICWGAPAQPDGPESDNAVLSFALNLLDQ